MPSGDPKKVVLKRVIGSRSEQVTLDKAGDGPLMVQDGRVEAL